MITLVGEKMASRVASSILKAAGLDELVCASLSGMFLYCVDCTKKIFK